MIEELQMIKDIVGDLSAVGGWVAAGVIAYKFIIQLIIYIGGGWLVNSIVTKAFAHFKADITRQEADIIIASDTKRGAEMEALRASHRAEMNEVKSMYKILKEANNVGAE